MILTSPCTKQWDELTSSANGRYCESCEKHIVDLSEKSDRELIEFFKNKEDKVCGRLLASQLNRTLVDSQQRLGWQWMMPLAVGAMFLSPAKANELKPVVEQGNSLTTSTSFLTNSPSRQHLVSSSISIKVVDEDTGLPLKGVKVRQKGFQNVLAVTDSLGRFELSLPAELATSIFTVELAGYAATDLSLTDGLSIKLKKEMVFRLGGVSILPLNKEPLYYVYSGKKSCTIDAGRIKEISPEWIENIEILKDVNATAIYGSRAMYGVIRIEIKKEFAKKIDFSKQN